MANAKEIRNRMEAVRETQKITNAMYLISSAKLRKAKKDLEDTQPYFNGIKGEIKRLFRMIKNVESRYFYPEDENKKLDGTYGYLLITADKGLAGAYNQNVLKEASRLLQEHKDAKIYVVGEYGRQYLMSHRIPIERSFLYTAQNPTLQRAREIAAVLLEQFDSGNIQKLFIIYTDYGNGMELQASSARLLPLHRAQFHVAENEKEILHPFEFVPSVKEVLENIVPGYVEGFIFSALIDSFCCEQSARMSAMDAANRNAEKMIQSMKLEYNHIRQGAITREITEVCAGARYQKRKRQEKRREQAAGKAVEETAGAGSR